MVKTRITSRVVEQAKHREDGPLRQILFDDHDTGLGLRLYESGKKSWVFQYGPRSRRRLKVLGRVPSMTVAQARDAARSQRELLRQGVDPIESAREDREAATPTRVGDLLDKYRESRVEDKKSKRDIERRIEVRIRPAIGRVRLDDPGLSEKMERLYREVGEGHPYEANRLLALMHTVFNFAKGRKLFPSDQPNPAYIRASDRFREQLRKDQRTISDEEFVRLVAEIEKEEDLSIKTGFKLLLATGCRKREILSARWENIDFDTKTLRLPDAKTGARPVPLSDYALELLQELRRESHSISGFVFPSPTKPGVPRDDVRKPWNRIREAAGCADIQIKDFRHWTATRVAMDNRNNPAAAQAALGHKNFQTTLRYIDPAQPARDAINKLGDSLRPSSEVTGRLIS